MLFLIDIGEEISKRRKAAGFTQAELAKMARVIRSFTLNTVQRDLWCWTKHSEHVETISRQV